MLGTLLRAGIIASFFFFNQLLGHRERDRPATPVGGARLPVDMLWSTFEVIFGAAAVFTLPILLYQVLRFIQPALETPQEGGPHFAAWHSSACRWC